MLKFGTGGGLLGVASVARDAADGHKLLFSPALVISVLPASRNDTGYEPHSLVPICQIFSNAMVIGGLEQLP
jgi:tripartite-type tricarboxylate transporter receptor subunit TctC